MEKNQLKIYLKSLLRQEFTDEQTELFQIFIEEIKRWSPKQNLVSKGDLERIVERHLADSLILAPYLKAKVNIVDIGPGAGFPGIPLAITFPENNFFLVEPRKKRVEFLDHLKIELKLSNTTIFQGNVEAFTDLIVDTDAIVLRAVGNIEYIFNKIRPFFKPGLEIFILTSDKKEQISVRGMKLKSMPYILHGYDWKGVVWKLSVSRETS